MYVCNVYVPCITHNYLLSTSKHSIINLLCFTFIMLFSELINILGIKLFKLTVYIRNIILSTNFRYKNSFAFEKKSVFSYLVTCHAAYMQGYTAYSSFLGENIGITFFADSITQINITPR